VSGIGGFSLKISNEYDSAFLPKFSVVEAFFSETLSSCSLDEFLTGWLETSSETPVSGDEGMTVTRWPVRKIRKGLNEIPILETATRHFFPTRTAIPTAVTIEDADSLVKRILKDLG
jgi:hypothetical protein